MDSERHFRTTSSNSSSSTTASSELFICFASLLSSSSSMKISSKSILSPGRARESSQISLSTSLSRRLKTSGSLKGGQASPMFPTGGKKRGCAFDNPEPSSPKVTCIGQVRVKTKKQGKKMRARSQKRRSNSEASFRKTEQVQAQSNGNDQQFVSHHLHQSSNSNNGGNGFQIQNSQQECLSHRNQKWVHLPFTICEALRAFGAELNCFLPCHSSCTNDRDKESKPAARSSESESSCGTVFARWLVAVEDGDGKGREIELVVGDEETRTEKENGSQRRHVFEGMEFKENNEVVEEEESRISICIPPKNALLLMRCRSDPVKMAELAKRFCESPAPKVEEADEEEEEDENDGDRHKEAQRDVPVSKKDEEEETKVEPNVKLKNGEEEMSESESVTSDGEEEVDFVLQEDEDDVEETIELGTAKEINEQQQQQVDITVTQNGEGPVEEEEKEEEKEEEIVDEDGETQQENFAEETTAILTTCEPEVVLDDAEKLESAEEDESSLLHGSEPDHETEEDEEENQGEQSKEEGDNGESVNPTSPSLSVQTERELDEEDETKVDGNWEENTRGSTEEKETREMMMMMMSWEDEEKATPEAIGPDIQNNEMGPDQPKERETPPPEPVRETETPVLPDCLLLMMYEPKLSMEVSKETWVCSTDFIRCVPTREKKPPHVDKTNARDPPKKRVNVETKPAENTQPVLQPARWSCSFPAKAAPLGTGVSMATMIEQKLVSANAYEPFVLTRCKSEPVRSSNKLAPDACSWKDRKLEPHRPDTFGVGAAGVGF